MLEEKMEEKADQGENQRKKHPQKIQERILSHEDDPTFLKKTLLRGIAFILFIAIISAVLPLFIKPTEQQKIEIRDVLEDKDLKEIKKFNIKDIHINYTNINQVVLATDTFAPEWSGQDFVTVMGIPCYTKKAVWKTDDVIYTLRILYKQKYVLGLTLMASPAKLLNFKSVAKKLLTDIGVPQLEIAEIINNLRKTPETLTFGKTGYIKYQTKIKDHRIYVSISRMGINAEEKYQEYIQTKIKNDSGENVVIQLQGLLLSEDAKSEDDSKNNQ